MEVATSFFHACEQGGGQAGTADFCAEGAGFTVQAVNALSGPSITECKTVAEYAEVRRGGATARAGARAGGRRESGAGTAREE